MSRRPSPDPSEQAQLPPIDGPPVAWRAGSGTTAGTALALRQDRGLTPADAAVEKIIDENNLRPVWFLRRGVELARAVCKIVVPRVGLGTGFFVGEQVVMTNHHVIADEEQAAVAYVVCNDELDQLGRAQPTSRYACRPDVLFATDATLDYTVVALAEPAGREWGSVPLVAAQAGVGDRVNIIQHPMGGPKELAIVDNEVRYVDATVTQYLTDTMPGSSGAPVFDDAWSLVALHHSGGWIPEPDTDSTHFRNEGITVRAIVADLQARGILR